jgi:hypothetical protein
MEPHYVKVENCFDYLRRVNELTRRAWVYRGHSVSCACAADEGDGKKNFRLVTSVHRFLNEHRSRIGKDKWIPRERDHIARFMSTAKGLLRNYPGDEDTISWLGLMQHFGYPTRLLDFTFSPAVALYFAMENASPNAEFAGVHALHIDSIRRHTQHLRGTKDLNPCSSAYMIGRHGQKHAFVGVCPGRWANERQEAQEGVFLVSSKIDLDIEKWLRSMPLPKNFGKPSNWIKYAVPTLGDEYYLRLKELKNIGLAPNRIYPGLGGVCAYYKWSWFDPGKDLG